MSKAPELVEKFRQKGKNIELSVAEEQQLQLVAEYQQAWNDGKYNLCDQIIGVLYVANLDKIYSYVYMRVGNHQYAEEITSEVFIRMVKYLPTFKSQGKPFSAWLYRIAHNLTVNWKRDQKKHTHSFIDDLPFLASKEASPEAQALRNAAREELLQQIRKLPPDRQQLLILKFGEGLSNEQIGVIMGKSKGAIKSLYHRTLISLREELEMRGC